jgi:hypothetical protein
VVVPSKAAVVVQAKQQWLCKQSKAAVAVQAKQQWLCQAKQQWLCKQSISGCASKAAVAVPSKAAHLGLTYFDGDLAGVRDVKLGSVLFPTARQGYKAKQNKGT